MAALVVALLAFAVADLVIWSFDDPGPGRRVLAVLSATAIGSVVPALSGQAAVTVIFVFGLGSFVSSSIWLQLSRRASGNPLLPLAFMLIVIGGAFAVSGNFAAVSGPLDAWYRDLPFPVVARVSCDQFLMALAAALFLLATANQIVRLVLDASKTDLTKGESTLKGGRVIGPMERLFVMAMVVSGAVVAAAALIAAKGLLRLPEIRTSADQRSGRDDEVTEYFLIGTFTSLLLAAALGGLISAAG